MGDEVIEMAVAIERNLLDRWWCGFKQAANDPYGMGASLLNKTTKESAERRGFDKYHPLIRALNSFLTFEGDARATYPSTASSYAETAAYAVGLIEGALLWEKYDHA